MLNLDYLFEKDVNIEISTFMMQSSQFLSIKILPQLVPNELLESLFSYDLTCKSLVTKPASKSFTNVKTAYLISS